MASTHTTGTRGYSATKEQLQKRVRRIEGQVRGVQGMVEEDRYCIDVPPRSARSRPPWTRSRSGCSTTTPATASWAPRAERGSTGPTSSWPPSGGS